jgi:hypothetical protein
LRLQASQKMMKNLIADLFRHYSLRKEFCHTRPTYMYCIYT